MSDDQERLFQAVFHGISDAVIVANSEGLVVKANAAFEALFGFAERDIVGQPVDHLYAGRPADTERSPLVEGLGSGITCRDRYQRRNGGVFWGETTCAPLLDEHGACRGTVTIIRGISDRARLDDTLTALLALTATGPGQFDQSAAKLIDLGCRYFGLELGVLSRIDGDDDHVEGVGGSLPLVTVGQRLALRQLLSTLPRGDDGLIAIQHSRVACYPFGAAAGIEAFLVSDVRVSGEVYGALSFADRSPRDRAFDENERLLLRLMAQWISFRLEDGIARSSLEDAHRRLARNEERYRYLYEKAPAMLHSIDGSGCLASVSELWLATMGYDREEVIGRRSSDFLTEESRRYAEEVVLPAYRETGRCDDVEYQFVTKGGVVRDILLSAITQYGDDHQFDRSLAVLVDVTERKQVERLLHERTEALERSNRDLARFAYIASHDLQEPLRRVVTYCQILMEDFGTEVSEEAAEVIEIIQSGGKRLRMMINDLLAYSRLNEQLEQAFEPVDMAAILCHAIDDLADKLEASGAQVDAVHLPLVWGRAPLLQMVCYHLMSNAIKYAGDQAPHVDISIHDQGGFWQLAVTDRGIGIEPRFADRIFEIFQRLHRRDDYDGSGAGLAICKLIIQRHGGAIWLDPDYEGGARFLFTLPKERPV